jgi:hypothetical protein
MTVTNIYFIAFFSLIANTSREQIPETQPQPIIEEQLEMLAGKSDAEVEDDSYWQKLTAYNKHPLNLNRADKEELQALGLLTGLQIKNFLEYRKLFGELLAVEELQAIPAWNVETIKQLLPYVKVENQLSLDENFLKRWRGGDHHFLLRVSQVTEKSIGFEAPSDSASSHYLGSPQRFFFRYTYNYRNLLQYGILGDKDAGEQFFRGYQRYGFDFYSFHFFAKKAGLMKAIALGDFTVNMGQGLIQWQGLAFTKTADALAIKRQSGVLNPYHSAGEFNFHRGVGLTLSKGPWQITGFLSIKKISTNLVHDTISREDEISSFENSGYHRTRAENDDRNNTGETAIGGNINFSTSSWHIGINSVYYHFSKPVQKQDQPYNLFAIRGNSWSDFSADYSYTYHNLHCFGEAAIDKRGHQAFVNGFLVGLASNLDAAFLYRHIAKDFQSLYANAFTENVSPNNERGAYAGLSLRPFSGWRLDAFFDIFTFPWLKYGTDAPTYGRDFFVRVSYQLPNHWSLYLHYKSEAKQSNGSAPELATHPVLLVPRQDWRIEIAVSISRVLSLRSRVECLWYNKKSSSAEEGMLGLIDLNFRPFKKSYTWNLSLEYFETGGYNSRIYVYERDVLYSFSLPAYYDKGFRYSLFLNVFLNKVFHLRQGIPNMEGWIRWAGIVYPGKTSVGSGLDSIEGNKKNEIKFQFLISWR